MRGSFTTSIWNGSLISTRVLNRGLLPPGYYALAEQIAGGLGPDVLTLQRPASISAALEEPPAVSPWQRPRRGFVSGHGPSRTSTRPKAKTIVIRHISDHRIIAICEVVSPGQ